MLSVDCDMKLKLSSLEQDITPLIPKKKQQHYSH